MPVHGSEFCWRSQRKMASKEFHRRHQDNFKQWAIKLVARHCLTSVLHFSHKHQLCATHDCPILGNVFDLLAVIVHSIAQFSQEKLSGHQDGLSGLLNDTETINLIYDLVMIFFVIAAKNQLCLDFCYFNFKATLACIYSPVNFFFAPNHPFHDI